jgi:hypothetical protein
MNCEKKKPGPSGIAVCGVDLQPFAFWDCGFESHRMIGHLSLVNSCCQVEVSVSTEHSPRGVLPKEACLSVILKPYNGGPGPVGQSRHRGLGWRQKERNRMLQYSISINPLKTTA